MILANVRRDVPPKVALVGEKISLVAAGAMLEEAAAIELPTSHVINVLDEQPSVSNKKLPPVFDAAVLEDPNGWLDDEHTPAAQHLLQEQHTDVAGLQSTSLQVHQNI